ncbi:DoxX family protein [Streptomyces sp. NPDC051582]|uniref:DoxX family protein n=1 Tax=Streptomyces sp. NPDC051582 TaxID=3155167 RepID=UPI0034450DF9
MAALRKLARPLLAAPFVSVGLRTLQRPEAVAEVSRPAVRVLGKHVPLLAARDPLQVVRVAGAVQASAALLLATGRAPRVAALTLAAALVPTSLAAHAFWTVEDPEERARQRARFLTDLSALGGLLIAAADTHGKPSLAHRSRRALAHRHPVRTVRRPLEAVASRTARRAADVASALPGPR